MKTTKQKKAVSPAKLAANRANAQHSTGPRSEEGKNKSSQNAWRHGICAKRLFPTPEQQDREGEDFALILNGVGDHYRPVGFWENFWAEKVAIEAFRSVRVLSEEQGIFDSTLVFEIQSIDKILRYEAAANRQLAQAIKHLEHLQEARRAKFQQDPSSHKEVTNPPPDQNEMEEQPQKENQSSGGPDVPPSGDYGTNPTVSDDGNNAISVAPTIENCGTNPPRDQNEMEEQPQKENQSSGGPDVSPSVDYGTNPTVSDDANNAISVAPTIENCRTNARDHNEMEERPQKENQPPAGADVPPSEDCGTNPSPWSSGLPPGWPLNEHGKPKLTNLLMPDGGEQRAQSLSAPSGREACSGMTQKRT